MPSDKTVLATRRFRQLIPVTEDRSGSTAAT
jgi:hypothetical protein